MIYEFTEDQISFLESEKQNGLTATLDSSAAYVRNLDDNIKRQYEAIYKAHINKRFIVCLWCSQEVFAMVRDVHITYNMYKAHEAYKQREAASIESIPGGEPLTALEYEPKKLSRNKRH